MKGFILAGEKVILTRGVGFGGVFFCLFGFGFFSPLTPP